MAIDRLRAMIGGRVAQALIPSKVRGDD